LYLCRPGGLPNQLLLHTPEHLLRDASAAAGVDLLDYSSGALLVDLDGDLDLDLLVATGTGLVFFVNDGAGQFTRKLLLERSLATSLAAADFDLDGDVDVYVCSYLSPYEENGLPVPYHDANNGEANMLLRNDGDWTFVDAAAEVGMDANNRRFSLAASWEDFDNDGDPDLYVVNDFGRNNLYRNDAGQFSDVAAELSAQDISAGMGVDWADVNHDGWMDLYVTNMHSPAGARLTSAADFRGASAAGMAQAYRDHAHGNTLLLNQAGRGFRDASESSGTNFGRWGWGAIFLDFDNDGALDLFAPNGFVSGARKQDLDSFFWRQVVLQSPEIPGEPGENYSLGWRAVNRLVRQGFSWNGNERNVALWNTGNERFADVSAAIGLDFPDDSRAAARIDWDGDGDEDLIVSNRNAPMLRMLDNQQASGHGWIGLDLRRGESGRTAIGARVELTSTDGVKYLRTLHCGQGYLAQSSSRLHFGLGAAAVQKISVRWPGGALEEFSGATAGGAFTLVEGTAVARIAQATSAQIPTASLSSGARGAGGRTVLPTPLPLPRLVLQSWDSKPAAMLGITAAGPQGTGEPLLLVLWSVEVPASERLLQELGASADTLRGAGIRQIVALSVEAEKADRERAVATWKSLNWPFARGFVTEESLQVLELVFAALHDDAQNLQLPTSFLVDRSGRLVATYAGTLAAAQLCADLSLLDLDPEARRYAAVPFAGRWISGLPDALDSALAARLNAQGLARPASELELAHIEVREFSAAAFEYDSGVARQRQGRLSDAIGHYRRALTADASHVLAAQSLAVALHQNGDFSAALVAYKEAIRLEPGHAQTRCNLGYLYIAMKNTEGAESELRALRALHSELADTLEAQIKR
jgi:tetratricopeptide (TPR) repeat protein